MKPSSGVFGESFPSLSCLCPCLQSIPPSKSLISIAYTACCFFLQADSLLLQSLESGEEGEEEEGTQCISWHNESCDSWTIFGCRQWSRRVYAFLSFPFLFLPSSCVKSRNRKMKERSLNFSQDTVNKNSCEGDSDAVSKTKLNLRIEWKGKILSSAGSSRHFQVKLRLKSHLLLLLKSIESESSWRESCKYKNVSSRKRARDQIFSCFEEDRTWRREKERNILFSFYTRTLEKLLNFAGRKRTSITACQSETQNSNLKTQKEEEEEV